MTIWLAVLAGTALGYVFTRGDFCFHSTWRGLLRSPRELSLFRSYLVVLVVTTPVVQLLIGVGVIDPFIPAFAWQATIGGGLVFGIGMVVAATCITGMFYKLGGGMLGMVVALGAWALGDLAVYKGPLKGLRERLYDNPVTASTSAGEEEVATVVSLLGWPGQVALAGLAGLAVGYLVWRAPKAESPSDPRGQRWGWLPLGLATSAVLLIAWLLVDWHGGDYSFGTSGVPTQLWDIVAGNDTDSRWIPLALVSLVPGAFVAAQRSGTLWARSESFARFGQLAAGGLLMGVGAGLAGGCNLGHAMVGVPLLSMGSISATVAMVGGVVAADRVKRLVNRPG